MKLLSSFILLLSALLSFNSHAEQKITKGNWDIHYIAFPSSFIQPEIAKQYQLQRSKYLAVINISVLDNKDNDKAQNAYVSGMAKNLLGQRTKLEFVKVTEGEATYYLAQLKYDNEEIYNFEIDVQQGNKTETIKFSQKFYVD
ncbi:hypothetical protein GCM10008107_27000 [Psychrosphaera saromensis]|uniref:DUF4426 domain-containing protein n=1 Tax=Psychrosphaera saromensis TaxID=716813 RepID=A0A2S7UXL3_9GAMM|nr:DUF4426 domain-containing protein [Psychrosphaera saromensis]PQJ54011.1 hypothetical protein BTO11_10360 [Psychrosphaera saromensis]GHB76140.1 hypothetical protein GCM10008107_27000 [Psychrosphaera saromensis]GLQ14497.1 hypothetical protein GCM10007917_19520 [Psychrosphaera saromensis]